MIQKNVAEAKIKKGNLALIFQELEIQLQAKEGEIKTKVTKAESHYQNNIKERKKFYELEGCSGTSSAWLAWTGISDVCSVRPTTSTSSMVCSD